MRRREERRRLVVRAKFPVLKAIKTGGEVTQVAGHPFRLRLRTDVGVAGGGLNSGSSLRKLGWLEAVFVAAAAVDGAVTAAGVSLGWLEEANPLMAGVVSWLFRSGCLWTLPLLKACICGAAVLFFGYAREVGLRNKRVRTVRMVDDAVRILLVVQVSVAFFGLTLLAYCYHNACRPQPIALGGASANALSQTPHLTMCPYQQAPSGAPPSAVFGCIPGGHRPGAHGSRGGEDPLRRADFTTVSAEAAGATLGDHCGLHSRKAKLSREVYFSGSVAALGMAVHDEVGPRATARHRLRPFCPWCSLQARRLCPFSSTLPYGLRDPVFRE